MAQTLTQIRALLEAADLRPQKMFGQNFMIDQNLMARLVDLAEIAPGEQVLEVGPGTGALTERLLDAGASVLAVEIDRGLAGLLTEHLGGREGFGLLNTDVLAGKHRINPEVLKVLHEGGPQAKLVSNLPYNIATSLLVECLLLGRPGFDAGPALRFTSLTFTVQREVTDRLAAGPGSGVYGPVSVLVALYGRVTAGLVVPPEAFWPRPKVTSRMMRIDVAPSRPDDPAPGVLSAVLVLAFGQRRKRIGSAGGRQGSRWTPEQFQAALAEAGIDPNARPEQVAPEAFAALARLLER